MLRRALALATLLLSGLAPASAIEPVEQGQLMWSAFTCSVYGSLAGDQASQVRLFEAGLKAGRLFYEAALSGAITTEDMRTKLPFAVTMRMGGPSIDFRVGVLYAAAEEYAYDSVVKTGPDGMMQHDPGKWLTDDASKRISAQMRFQQGNCLLLK